MGATLQTRLISFRWRLQRYTPQLSAWASGNAAGERAMSSGCGPPPSKRVRVTDDPCIVTMQKMLQGREGILSLAQGVVHWSPPSAVAEAVSAAASEPDSNQYGADAGLPALRAALKEKLHKENGLSGVEVMVTAGANQGYTNVVVALLDAQDGAV